MTCWPRDLFGVKNGYRKTWFCDGIILSWQFKGFPVTQMNSMVHRTHLGRLLCQKPCFLIIFERYIIFQENWKTPQPITWAIAYSPWWAIAYSPWAGHPACGCKHCLGKKLGKSTGLGEGPITNWSQLCSFPFPMGFSAQLVICNSVDILEDSARTRWLSVALLSV